MGPKSQVQCCHGFKSLVLQGTFVPESTFSTDSLMVSAQPPCAITCINICISDISMCLHTKMSTLVATPLFGHIEILHVLVGMDNILLKKDEEEGESGFGSRMSLMKKPFTFYFSRFLCMVCS